MLVPTLSFWPRKLLLNRPSAHGVHRLGRLLCTASDHSRAPQSSRKQSAQQVNVVGNPQNRGKKIIIISLAALIDGRGKVLMGQRMAKKAKDAGLWELPGGKMHHGETPEGALKRELREELGLELEYKDMQPMSFCTTELNPKTNGIILLFGITTWGNEPEGKEGQALEWVDADDIIKRPVTEGCQQMHHAISHAAQQHCRLETAITT